MLNDLYQSLDPVAFSIGSISVRWYGLAYLAGFFFTSLTMWKVQKRWRLGMTIDDLMMFIVLVAFGLIVGARAFYVLFYNLDFYLANPGHILMFTEGGMSFHGGFAGAVVGGLLACRYLKISFITMADMTAIGAPIGLFFGRCANFVNGELWGSPCDLPWAVMFETGGGIPRHPSQLYEAVLEGLVIFAVLFWISRKLPPRPKGSFLGTFMILYGCFRFLIEFVRVPDVQLGYLFGFITMGQLLTLPVLLIGIAMVVVSYRVRKPQRL